MRDSQAPVRKESYSVFISSEFCYYKRFEKEMSVAIDNKQNTKRNSVNNEKIKL